MDLRAYRVAQAFVAAQVRRARYSQEFLQWTSGRSFRNPDTGNEVKFISLPVPEQVKIFRQWKTDNPEEAGRPPQSRAEATAQNINIAREGEIVTREKLSEGGESGGPGVNVSEIVRMRHDGKDQIYIRKPADGEEPHIRVGIPGGTYHAREQASFGIDQLMGGRGIVPATITRGSEDGSYQVWDPEGRPMYGEDRDALAGKVGIEDLHRSPAFHRLNALDLITGHEDRHAGNIMFSFDGDETPENLQFSAIDNGLTMGSPSELPDHRVFVHPFGSLYVDDPDWTWEEQQKAHDKAEKDSNKAIAESLRSLSPELHEQIRGMKMDDVARTLVDAGVHERGAVRAALVRIAALQEDPKIFGQFLRRHQGNLEEAWQNFQFSSGDEDDLLKRAEAEDRAKEIDEALERNKPKKWTSEEELAEQFQAMQDALDSNRLRAFGMAGTERPGDDDPFGSWAVMFDDDETPPEEPATRRTKAARIRDRWLRSALRRTASGR